ncbi:serine hydrolase domain-containing protein [Evansella sp. AB-rgal1]|uniref:serine hydrolase domain-containing protein n=1 Tax=Evansella sp. AB-rgal1 TaxID=3242696 RepID=UPI00359E3A0F
MIKDSLFYEVVEKMVKNKHVYGAVLCVEKGDGSLSFVSGGGNIKAGDRYFIASVTKLYITAVMLMLREQKRLNFEDNIYRYFPEKLIHGIHILDGVDYTKEITIAHLLSNTSGIPDYFYYHKKNGEAATDLLQGNDEPWPLEKAIESAKGIKPKFKPGQKGKVHYSDTNYQLLGAIIEKITGKWIGDVFKDYIFDPLNLKDTYVYQDINDTKPVPIFFKTNEVHAPNYMASVSAEGGIISTAQEVMVFLKAFFTGFFFPVEVLEELKVNWNMIYFPGQFFYGLGLEKLWTPRFLSPFKPIGEVLGFWGQTGAFAFYNPDTDLYFTGTVNQASGFGHSAAYHAIMKIIKSA